MLSIPPKATAILVGLVPIVLLLSAAPAGADSAGSEYLPQVPTATGHQALGQGAKGQRSTGAPNAGSTSSPVSGGGSGGDSSGPADTILNPIVLFLLAGVLAIGAGMILIRRPPRDGPGSPTGEARREPPATPDGEIVGAGGDAPQA